MKSDKDIDYFAGAEAGKYKQGRFSFMKETKTVNVERSLEKGGLILEWDETDNNIGVATAFYSTDGPELILSPQQALDLQELLQKYIDASRIKGQDND